MRLPTDDDLQIHGHWECNDRMRRLLDSARLARELVPLVKRLQSFAVLVGLPVSVKQEDAAADAILAADQLLATIEDEGGGE